VSIERHVIDLVLRGLLIMRLMEVHIELFTIENP
jgi:hypothetical protein